MVARPGRVVPSVIVGGLLTVGMTVGMGTASAEGTCQIEGVSYSIGASSAVTAGAGEACMLDGGLLSASDALTNGLSLSGSTAGSSTSDDTTTGDSSENDGATGGDVLGGGTPIDTTPGGTQTNGGATGNLPNSGGAGTTTTPTTPTTPSTPVAVPQARPAAQPVLVPGPLAADRALAAGLPGLAPGGVMTPALAMSLGAVPEGLNLLGTTPYDPALLLAAPAGSPMRTMAGADPASLVTSSSQIQAMAFDGLPDGVGVPATLGSLIIAALGAFALRHRLVGRVRREEAESAATTVTTETAGA